MRTFRNIYPYEFEMLNDLICLIYDYRIYVEVYENLYEVSDIQKVFSTIPFLSEETNILLLGFREKWYAYNKSKTYSADSVFVYLDEEFIKIVDLELLQFIKSIISDTIQNGFNDFKKHNIETSLNNRKFPDMNDILERVTSLYKDIHT